MTISQRMELARRTITKGCVALKYNENQWRVDKTFLTREEATEYLKGQTTICVAYEVSGRQVFPV